MDIVMIVSIVLAVAAFVLVNVVAYDRAQLAWTARETAPAAEPAWDFSDQGPRYLVAVRETGGRTVSSATFPMTVEGRQMMRFYAESMRGQVRDGVFSASHRPYVVVEKA